MALFVPQNVLEDIVSRIDIVGLTSEYMTLQKVGKDYKGLCPFHEEKSPSFMVDSIKGVYHCFGCGAGGNFFSLVEKLEGLNFVEVIQFLANRAGVDLSPYENNENQSQVSKLEPYYRVMKYAEWFFQQKLLSSEGEKARSYLSERGFSEEIINSFHIGFADDKWEDLFQFLNSKKIPAHYGVDLGLIRPGKQSGFYDFYRGRIIFPITNLQDKIIGFGGRTILEDDSAKYINSPESLIYHKSKVLYGLNQSYKNIRTQNKVIITEGYFDVMRLHELGLNYSVAPLGTALTKDQIILLKKYTANFYFMFDSDKAGVKAIIKSIYLSFEQGIHPKIISLPEGEDPDSFGRKSSQESFQSIIKDAPYAMDWLWQYFLSDIGTNTNDRVNRSNELLDFIKLLPNQVEREIYKSKLAQFLGVDAQNIKLNSAVSHHTNQQQNKFLQNNLKLNPESMMVRLYFKYPETFEELGMENILTNFENNTLKQILNMFREIFTEQKVLNMSNIEGIIKKNYRLSLLADLEKLDMTADQLATFHSDYTKTREKQKLKQQLSLITGELQLAEINQDKDKIKELLKLKSEIQYRIKNFKN